MNYIIENANIVDARGQRKKTLYVTNGLFAEKCGENAQVLDCKGLTLMPAFVDMHTHFRDPGFTYKEDVITGSDAAAAGGYTVVNCMPNTKPVCSSEAIAADVMDRAQEHGKVYLHQCVSITKDFDGKTTDHLRSLGGRIRAISEDGKWVMSNHVMRTAMEIARENNLLVCSHAEDMEISPYDYRMAENIATKRDLYLADQTECRLHMCHVSTKEAIGDIARAKKHNPRISCEVTPHHIWFSDTGYRVNPPIREAKDVEALIAAIQQGVVDCIGTDHAPHSQEDKKNGSPGMIGLETAFAVCYTKLVREKYISLPQLSQLMSLGGARLLGLNQGLIMPGMQADFVLLQTEKPYVVDAEQMHSKSKNTPFDGEQLYGEILATYRAGQCTYQKNKKGEQEQ